LKFLIFNKLISCLKTIIRSGICVTATTNVIKKSKMRNGNIVLQGDVHGPDVATGTTVTSANSGVAGGTTVKFP
jgi:hypothetical protein